MTPLIKNMLDLLTPDEALSAMVHLKMRHGWVGNLFTRGDAESALERPLTEAEWEKLRASEEWRVIDSRGAEHGRDYVNDAVLPFDKRRKATIPELFEFNRAYEAKGMTGVLECADKLKWPTYTHCEACDTTVPVSCEDEDDLNKWPFSCLACSTRITL